MEIAASGSGDIDTMSEGGLARNKNLAHLSLYQADMLGCLFQLPQDLLLSVSPHQHKKREIKINKESNNQIGLCRHSDYKLD